MSVTPVFRDNSIHSRFAFALGLWRFQSTVRPARTLIILFGAEKSCSKDPILRKPAAAVGYRIRAPRAHPVRSTDRLSPVHPDSVPHRADHRSDPAAPGRIPIHSDPAADILPARVLRPGRRITARIPAGIPHPVAHADLLPAGSRSADPASPSDS